MTMRGFSAIIIIIALAAAVFPAFADTPRERYDQADQSINGGDGYKTYTNETATLAWGESYIMMSYIAAYKGTGDLAYLDKLADHADHVLAGRDDARGVTDYRAVQGACWRNLHYQPNDEPYCYVVHSGMITSPMADFVKVVRDDPAIWNLQTYDGATYLEKAESYVAAIYETLAYHEDQWQDSGDAGYYTFCADATFLQYAGEDLPLNQGNALGRTIVTLAGTEQDSSLEQRAERMARWFADQLDYASFYDAYRWNYWGGRYDSPGEDISHAAINADFAARAGQAGLVFDQTDLARFAHTFSRQIYWSSRRRYDHVGGTGSVNSPGYTEQTGRWLALSQYDPTVYCAVRNQFDAMDTATGSGSVVLGFGNVLRFDLPEITDWYFTMDGWNDRGDHRVPVSDQAGIYFEPGKGVFSKVALTYQAYQLVTLRQQSDSESRITARLGKTDGAPRTLYFGARHDTLDTVDGYGVLIRVKDALRVYEGQAVPEPAAITSEPKVDAVQFELYRYNANASGTHPIHFTAKLDGQPAGIDKLTGRFTHSFTEPGDVELVVTARNTGGTDLQAFTINVAPAPADDDDDDDDDNDDNDDDTDDDTGDDDAASSDGDDDDDQSEACCG